MPSTEDFETATEEPEIPEDNEVEASTSVIEPIIEPTGLLFPVKKN